MLVIVPVIVPVVIVVMFVRMAFVAVFGMGIDVLNRRFLIVFEGVCGGQLLCLPGAGAPNKETAAG